jgi:hypothetical protein
MAVWGLGTGPDEGIRLDGSGAAMPAASPDSPLMLQLQASCSSQVSASGAAALPAVSLIARAQAYPARPVRIIVGFAAGGTTEIAARLMHHEAPGGGIVGSNIADIVGLIVLPTGCRRWHAQKLRRNWPRPPIDLNQGGKRIRIACCKVQTSFRESCGGQWRTRRISNSQLSPRILLSWKGFAPLPLHFACPPGMTPIIGGREH